MEGVHGHLLVVAGCEWQARPRGRAECDRERRPLGVAGQILGRVTDRNQALLEYAAKSVVDGKAGGVDPSSQVVANPLLSRQLLEQDAVLGDQSELALDTAKADAAVATDQVAKVRRQVRGDRELAVR